MASSDDLVGLADFKAWLDMQSDDDDTLLATLITQTSRTILTYLDRASVLPAVHTETRDGANESAIVPRQWPVTSILSLTIDGTNIAPASSLSGGSWTSGYVLEPASHAPPGRMQKLALRGKCFSAGVQNILISYQAGYHGRAGTGAVERAIHARSSGTLWNLGVGSLRCLCERRTARCRRGRPRGGTIFGRRRRLSIRCRRCRQSRCFDLRLCACRSRLLLPGLGG